MISNVPYFCSYYFCCLERNHRQRQSEREWVRISEKKIINQTKREWERENMDDQIMKFKEKSFDSHEKLAFESNVWTTVHLTPIPPVNYHQVP